MNAAILGELFRKVIPVLLGGFRALLVRDGVITQGDASQWMQTTAAILAFVVTACWTRWILPFLKKMLSRPITTTQS